MKWIWVRHGETIQNQERRYLGHFNASLTENGRKQVEQVAARLAGEKITRIYSSDLERCKKTAEIISSYHHMIPVEVKALRELNFGLWDGKTYEEIMKDDRELVQKWYDNPFDFSPPQGETLNQLGRRIDKWLEEECLKMNNNDTIVFVSHGGPIRWIQSKWLLNDPHKFWSVPNVLPGECIHIQQRDQRWEMF